MYYNISKFPLVYVSLRKTIKDIVQLVIKKKLFGKKPKISNCLTNRHPDCKIPTN